MAKKLWMIGRVAIFAVMALVTFCLGMWGALALWYRLPGNLIVRTIGGMIWAVGALALIVIAVIG